MRINVPKVFITTTSLFLFGLIGCDVEEDKDEALKMDLIECEEGMWLKNLRVVVESGELAYRYTEKDFRMTNRYIIQDLWGADWEGELRINRITGEYVATYKPDSFGNEEPLTQEGTCKFNSGKWKRI